MKSKGKEPPRGTLRPDAGESFEYPEPRLPGDLDDIEQVGGVDNVRKGPEGGTDGDLNAAAQPRRNNVIPFRPSRKRD